jgi:hypothetical protein
MERWQSFVVSLTDFSELWKYWIYSIFKADIRLLVSEATLTVNIEPSMRNRQVCTFVRCQLSAVNTLFQHTTLGVNSLRA